MMDISRTLFPLPNPLPHTGEGVKVGSARPNRSTMRGQTF